VAHELRVIDAVVVAAPHAEELLAQRGRAGEEPPLATGSEDLRATRA
jgi:hypothetical protein